MTKTALTQPENKPTLHQLSSMERRKLKKIAVEKQRRARMNRSLAALRDILQEEAGEMEDADTSQILDMAVSFLRETRRHVTRPRPVQDVTRITSCVPRVLPPPPMAPLVAARVPTAYSEADIHKLVENQREMDRAEGLQVQENALGVYPHGVMMVRAAYNEPEGLLLRNLDNVLRGGHFAIMGPRGAYWRPW